MSGNTLGTLFCVTNFGESHGPAIGCVVDGCPPGLTLEVADIQHELDRRRPGTSRHVTQRQEADQVEILSGVYQGVTTGAPIALLIRNTDQRSKDYAQIAERFGARLARAECDAAARQATAKLGEACDVPQIARYEVAGIPFVLRFHQASGLVCRMKKCVKSSFNKKNQTGLKAILV